MFITIQIMNSLINKKFILASSSKSRRKILKQSGLNFQSIKPNCSEEDLKKTLLNKKIKPKDFAMELSFNKSLSISKIHKSKYVVGCDTLISFNDKIVDKAKTIKYAEKKLLMMSGKKHKIISAVTICKNGKKLWQDSDTSEIKIRNINRNEIRAYLKMCGKQILNSVGCYQIEALGPLIIEETKGDFFNIMGLPLFKLLKHLSKLK